MKKSSEVVNVAPVIAKSDSLSLDERTAFKLKVGLFNSILTVSISTANPDP